MNEISVLVLIFAIRARLGPDDRRRFTMIGHWLCWWCINVE